MLVKYGKYSRMLVKNIPPTQQRPSTNERAQAPIDCPASARSTTTKPGLGHYLLLPMLTMHLVEVATQACYTTMSEHLSWYFVCIYIRVSQKTQKSEFCFATNPSGFHRLVEPPEKFQHYRPTNDITHAIFSFTL